MAVTYLLTTGLKVSYEVGSTWSPRLQGSSWTWSHQSVGLTRPAGQPPSQKDQGRRWWHLQSHTNSNPNLGNQSECLCKGSSAIKSPWSCDQEVKSGGAQPKIRLQDACPGQHLVPTSPCHLTCHRHFHQHNSMMIILRSQRRVRLKQWECMTMHLPDTLLQGGDFD